MKKKSLRIVVIILTIVLLPILTFQTIKLATKPKSISPENLRGLTLEEGQEMYVTMYDKKVDAWLIGGICLDLDCRDSDWITGYSYVNIENDFMVRQFQSVYEPYIIITDETGRKTYPDERFRVFWVDKWYVLEK